MNQITPYHLWIGHAGEGQDYRHVYDAGIQAIVHLAAEELPPQSPRDLICCHFPLLDSTGNRSSVLALAIRTVSGLLQSHIPTLVICSRGVSRAPALAAAALAITFQQSAEDALAAIVRQYPSDVSPGFWSEITGILPTL